MEFIPARKIGPDCRDQRVSSMWELALTLIDLPIKKNTVVGSYAFLPQ